MIFYMGGSFEFIFSARACSSFSKAGLLAMICPMTSPPQVGVDPVLSTSPAT